MWSIGIGSPEERPDKTHVVLGLYEDTDCFKQIILEVLEVTPGASKNVSTRKVVEEFLLKGVSVLITTSGQQSGTFILAAEATLPYYTLPVLKKEKIDVLTPSKYFAEAPA